MTLGIVSLIIIAGLVGIVFVQSYSIKTLSDSLENYAYTCNKLAHEIADMRRAMENKH